ncbi:MAG: type II toxin-antitoxin system RelB/DinJ family antitoxin [Bacilli bacterium]|nr:type II toxin-antitoxin system RelB/DinJ family antitoxin [Bacilli bacterium]
MTLINVRIEDDLKKEAETILNEMGLNMTTAINVYLKAIVRTRKIPFEIMAPNAQKEDLSKSLEKEITDPEVLEIKDWVLKQDYVSITNMVREMKIGFTKAGRLFDKLIREGLIEEKPTGTKGNKVIK